MPDTTFDALVLTPVSRWPLTLPPQTVAMIEAAADLTAMPAVAPTETAPHVSVIVATHNNRTLLTLCVRSVLMNGAPGRLELIVIDNGSADGTADYLRRLARRDGRVRIISNDANRGFAAATNQGLAAARGDIAVLLNDDTAVPPGSLAALVKHLDDAAIGVVGAVTNRAGNEAQIDTSYHTYGEMVRFALDHMAAHRAEQFDVRTALMFCVAMRREAWSRVGVLDEQFEIGMFEDEDYSMRMRAAGYRVVCAEDSFVHHFGQASLGKLAATHEYGKLFHANRRRWEEKWGRAWQPYARRPNALYRDASDRIRAAVSDVVPSGATVMVVSKGDDNLLDLDGRRGWHFPQADDGAYAGFHPADSESAIRHLEALRDRGGDFLVLPESTMWWLHHYAEFTRHLETRYVTAWRDDTGVIFDVR